MALAPRCRTTPVREEEGRIEVKPCSGSAMILGPRDRPAIGCRLGWDPVRTDQVIHRGRVRATLLTRFWLLRVDRAIRVATALSGRAFRPSISEGSLRLRDAAPDVYVPCILCFSHQ